MNDSESVSCDKESLKGDAACLIVGILELEHNDGTLEPIVKSLGKHQRAGTVTGRGNKNWSVIIPENKDRYASGFLGVHILPHPHSP